LANYRLHFKKNYPQLTAAVGVLFKNMKAFNVKNTAHNISKFVKHMEPSQGQTVLVFNLLLSFF